MAGPLAQYPGIVNTIIQWSHYYGLAFTINWQKKSNFKYGFACNIWVDLHLTTRAAFLVDGSPIEFFAVHVKTPRSSLLTPTILRYSVPSVFVTLVRDISYPVLVNVTTSSGLGLASTWQILPQRVAVCPVNANNGIKRGGFWSWLRGRNGSKAALVNCNGYKAWR